MRIAVCDDEPVYKDIISNVLSDICLENGVEALVQGFTDPEAMLQSYREQPYDAVYLDIDMPKITGFDIADEIRENRTCIVFVSAKKELVYDSFEYHPFFFICKSDVNTMIKDLRRVAGKMLDHHSLYRTVTVDDRVNGLAVIELRSIRYIMSSGHYVSWVTENGEYIDRTTLAEASRKVDNPMFVRIHQRTIVNLYHVRQYCKETGKVLMSNQQKLPISKPYMDASFQAFLRFKRN